MKKIRHLNLNLPQEDFKSLSAMYVNLLEFYNLKANIDAFTIRILRFTNLSAYKVSCTPKYLT